MEPLQKEVNLAESVVISAMLYVCKVDFHVPISAWSGIVNNFFLKQGRFIVSNIYDKIWKGDELYYYFQMA